ncbi:MAG TPA: YHYH domain-containing protein [Steroidobacteraceae bacterium]
MVRHLVAIACLSFASFAASPHSGNTDPYGCHEDEKTGAMHCHDAAGNELPWPPVKKSRSGICHNRDSQWYAQTIHFEPFNTIKKCLESGGRLPKN